MFGIFMTPWMGCAGATRHEATPEQAMQYLRDGLPASLDGVAMASGIRRAHVPRQRWNLYIECAEVLGKNKSTEAIPLLRERLTAPLPAPLIEDATIALAMDTRPDATWNDWDVALAGRIEQLRGACAKALLAIGDETALPAIMSMLEAWEAEISAGTPRDALMPPAWRLSAASEICEALIAAGKPEGMDHLIALLPHASADDYFFWQRLYELAGYRFPLPPQASPAQCDAVAQAWAAWWQANRDTQTLPIPKRDRPGAPDSDSEKPKTPEEHLRYIADYPKMICFPVIFGEGEIRRSRRWMDAHGAEHLELWRQLAEDPDEALAVRLEAGVRYVTLGGSDVVDWAQDLLMRLDSPSPENARQPLVISLLNATNSKAPARAIAIAQGLVSNLGPAAPDALLFLQTLPEASADSPDFIVAQYPLVAAKYPHVAYGFWAELSQKPLPGEEALLEQALRSGSVEDAARAAAVLRNRGTSAELSNEAKDALARWRENPAFIIREARALDDFSIARRQALRALDLMTETGPEAAWIYARIYTQVSFDSSVADDGASSRALEGLRQCATAYRASRSPA